MLNSSPMQQYVYLKKENWLANKPPTYNAHIAHSKAMALRHNLITLYKKRQQKINEVLSQYAELRSIFRSINNVIGKQAGSTKVSIEGLTDDVEYIIKNGADPNKQKYNESHLAKIKNKLKEIARVVPDLTQNQFIESIDSLGNITKYGAFIGLLEEQVNSKNKKDISTLVSEAQELLNSSFGQTVPQTDRKGNIKTDKNGNQLTRQKYDAASNILRGYVNNATGALREEIVRSATEIALKRAAKRINGTALYPVEVKMRYQVQDTSKDTKGVNRGDMNATVTVNGETINLGVQIKNWDFEYGGKRIWSHAIGKKTEGSFATAVTKAGLEMAGVANYLLHEHAGWESPDPLLNYIALSNFQDYFGVDVDFMFYNNAVLPMPAYLQLDGFAIQLAPKTASFETLNERVSPPENPDFAAAKTRSDRALAAFNSAPAIMY